MQQWYRHSAACWPSCGAWHHNGYNTPLLAWIMIQPTRCSLFSTGGLRNRVRYSVLLYGTRQPSGRDSMLLPRSPANRHITRISSEISAVTAVVSEFIIPTVIRHLLAACILGKATTRRVQASQPTSLPRTVCYWQQDIKCLTCTVLTSTTVCNLGSSTP
jgi:hypothetical protein